MEPNIITQWAEALLACPKMQNRDIRDAIIGELPAEWRNYIERSTADNNADVRSIVNSVLDYDPTMTELVNVLRVYEGPSTPMKAVDVLHRKLSSKAADSFPSSLDLNPFTDQGCIDNPKRFFNRQTELDHLITEVGAGRNVAVIGEAQVGKSSLLKQLIHVGPAELDRPASDFCYLDMQLLSGDADFFGALSHELGLPDNTRGYQLMRALGQRRVVICLDEFEKMRYAGFTAEVRSQLRGLCDGNDSPLTLITATRTPPAEIYHDDPLETSPLAPILAEYTLRRFGLETVRDFLRHRLAAMPLAFSEADETRLFEKSNGHPGQLQKFAHELYGKARGS